MKVVDKPWNLIQPKVIMITESASGFGKATALKLIAKGHIVYGGDIDTAGNGYLKKMGGIALAMDVTKTDQVNAGIQRILDEQERIDVLPPMPGLLSHELRINLFRRQRSSINNSPLIPSLSTVMPSLSAVYPQNILIRIQSYCLLAMADRSAGLWGRSKGKDGAEAPHIENTY